MMTANDTMNLPEMIVMTLMRRGITRCVASPGTRNAPLVEAASAAGMDVTSVVDERVAAFMALGIAATTGEPVALICTSGSAMLNYAPALAEALYRHIPLIALTADRPEVWIDRADSQTIRQPSALGAVVKRYASLMSAGAPDAQRHASLTLNELLIAATAFPQGPVHLNIPIDFTTDPQSGFTPRLVDIIEPEPALTVARTRQLGCLLASPRKVLIAAGGYPPAEKLNRALARLAELPNVAVVTEPTANLHGRLFIPSPEAAIIASDTTQLDRLCPDVVITVGGALVSAKLKGLLRHKPAPEHWVVGGMINGCLPDTFGSISTVVDLPAGAFMSQLASAMQPHRAPSTFGDDWRIASDRGASLLRSVVARAPWCGLKAAATLLGLVPKRWNVQVSNGMNIRYACLAACLTGAPHRFDCNRGVSGIDGSTSTAAGAALAYTSAPTLLLTGDMSALYDMSVLASGAIVPRLRIVVADNGGGGIFNFAKPTRNLACRPALLEHKGLTLPLSQIADGCGFDYFEAASEAELRRVWPAFSSESHGRPAIMRLITDGATDADIINSYYNQ